MGGQRAVASGQWAAVDTVLGRGSRLVGVDLIKPDGVRVWQCARMINRANPGSWWLADGPKHQAGGAGWAGWTGWTGSDTNRDRAATGWWSASVQALNRRHGRTGVDAGQMLSWTRRGVLSDVSVSAVYQ